MCFTAKLKMGIHKRTCTGVKYIPNMKLRSWTLSLSFGFYRPGLSSSVPDVMTIGYKGRERKVKLV